MAGASSAAREAWAVAREAEGVSSKCLGGVSCVGGGGKGEKKGRGGRDKLVSCSGRG